MHKILSRPITLDSFEIDDKEDWSFYGDDSIGSVDSADDCEAFLMENINFLEGIRIEAIKYQNRSFDSKYSAKEREFYKKKSKFLWKELIRWLPESWLQTRTVTLNYENLVSIVHQRKNHKLNEWSGIHLKGTISFIDWVKTLPYANELIFYKDIKDIDSKSSAEEN